MPATHRIQFTADIAAPPQRVYALMTGADSYGDWTAAFCEGSRYEGSWEPGARIRFLAPGGHGMVAEIAENRPGAFVSIRHLGLIHDGVEDTDSPAARAWAPAYENYTFTATPGGTRLVVDQDVTADFEASLREAWPRALARLQAMCEQA